MKTHTDRTHMVDFLFTIALFFVFAASLVAVILVSANAYRQTQSVTKSNYSARTSLSYIGQKIRQNDVDGGVSIGKIDDLDALVLKQQTDGGTYVTYIYQFEDELKELFVKEGANISPQTGNTILKLSSFTMEPVDDHLYRFTMQGTDGHTCDLVIGTKTT